MRLVDFVCLAGGALITASSALAAPVEPPSVSQADLVTRIKHWAAQYKSASNPVQKDYIDRYMTQDICGMTRDHKVVQWAGYLEALKTGYTTESNIRVVVMFGQDMYAVGDIPKTNQRVADQLLTAKTGMKIYFSGKLTSNRYYCYQDLNLFQPGRISKPLLVMDFEDISPR